VNILQNSQLLMPYEYKQIKKSINKLRASNYLGDRELKFTIIPSSFTLWYARDNGLCKNKECSNIKWLNPLRKYKNNYINEALRQDSLFGYAEAYAWSTGLIGVSQNTFSLYHNKNGFLECDLAHEIAHIKNNHFFESSKYKVKNNNLSKNKLNEKYMKFRRQQELEADYDAMLMLLNSGINPHACVDNLRYLHYTSSTYYETMKNSTHPGFRERIKKNIEFANHHIKDTQRIKRSKTNGIWKYFRNKNVLIFSPEGLDQFKMEPQYLNGTKRR